MDNENKVVSRKIDPVIDQKIIKEKRRKWLLWLLPLLMIILLFFIWFSQHQHQRTDNTASEGSITESNAGSAEQTNSQNVTPPSTLDSINGWFAGDKVKDSDWITLDGISFDSGSATPILNDDSEMVKAADILNRHPDTQVKIRGYADATGPNNLNDNLSSARANAVKQWLTDQNVEAGRISIEGQGDAAPVASNATKQGREMNRRVELKILANEAGK